jgi:hypothetical protein
MRDLGPIDCFHHFGFPYACALAAFPTQPVVAKRAARVVQPRAIDIGATTGSGNPQGQGTEVQAALDALPGLFIIHLTLMGMGSPDNRRKADGSYQTQGVGRGIFVPASPERADYGWASRFLDNRDLARGHDMDRRRGGLLV